MCRAFQGQSGRGRRLVGSGQPGGLGESWGQTHLCQSVHLTLVCLVHQGTQGGCGRGQGGRAARGPLPTPVCDMFMFGCVGLV